MLPTIRPGVRMIEQIADLHRDAQCVYLRPLDAEQPPLGLNTPGVVKVIGC